MKFPITAWLFGVALLAGCAHNAIEDAHRLELRGQHEAALQILQHAANENRADKELRNELLEQRDATVSYLVYLAEAARSGGQLEDVEVVLKRMEAAAPEHPRVAWLRTEVERMRRHRALLDQAGKDLDAQHYDKAEAALRGVLAEAPTNNQARALLNRIEGLRESQTTRNTTLQLATASKPITLEFREAALRTVFEALARAADVNFVFDKDVHGDAKVTLFLRNTTVDEALRVILNTQQLSYKLMNDNTVMVFPATQQKQRDLLDTVTRTFYLVNADPKQAQALVRTVAKTRDIFIDERLNMLVIRDTPEVVHLVERLIQNLDLADPEVMLDLEVMDVSDNELNSLGLTYPDTVSYGLPGSTGPISSFSGLHAFTSNPLALATLKASHDKTNILGNPKIRARNREKAHVVLGEKLPVFTTTSTPTNGAISNAVSINYVDVGLKLDVEPQVQLDNDVTIKVALEVSSITNTINGPQGSFAYQVGTRQATTTLRLKDGETQILAGLINDTESRSSSGIPGLHDLPLLGRLFGLTTNERKKSEVVLLITPHIIRNVLQPTVSGVPLASGTETQPGAPAMVLRDEASLSGVGARGNGPRAGNRSRALASSSAQSALSGPEEVMPGALFEVLVRNKGTEPLNTTLVFDPSLVSVAGSPNGRVAVTVPPRGAQSVSVQAKPDVESGDASFSLEGADADALSVRIRNPAAQTQENANGNPPSESKQ